MHEDLLPHSPAFSARPRARALPNREAFAPANSNIGPATTPELSVADKSALAMLRCGCSFADAAESGGLNVRRVMQLWAALR